MSIKLIVTDLDGTFYHRDMSYDKERFDRLLGQMHASGIRFAVASGNQYYQLITFFDHPEEMAFISENGALIINEGKELSVAEIERDVWTEAITLVRSYPEIHTLLVNGVNSAYCGMEMDDELVNIYRRYFPRLVKIEDFTTIDDRIIKMSLAAEEEHADRIAQELNEKLSGKLRAVTSGHGDIDLVKPGINKGMAIQKLLDIWNLKMEEVMTFGDAMNDREMLLEAGYGFVMANGNEQLKKEVGRVAPKTNEEDGELELIEEYLTDPEKFLNKYKR